MKSRETRPRKIQSRKIQSKAQSEVMGLIVLVTLIGLGMLIYLSATATKTNNNPTVNFDNKNIAVNFVTAYLETSLNCGGRILKMEDLLSIVYKEENIICDGNTANETLRQETEFIINNTLKEWGLKYYLESEAIKIANNCTAEMEKESPGIGFYPGRTSPRRITLYICK